MKKKSSHKHIYLVDDDLFFGQLFSFSVQNQLKLKVTTFTKPMEFISVLRNGQWPDVIFLDYHFGRYDHADINGLDLLQEIKKMNPKQMVVMVSASKNQQVLIQSEHEGANNFIVKSPHSMNSIINLLRNYYYKQGIAL